MVQANPHNIFSKKVMRWLCSLKLDNEEDSEMSESYLKLLEVINQEVASSNEMVKEIYNKDKDTQLLATNR